MMLILDNTPALARPLTFHPLPQSQFYQKEVIVADREFVESGSDECIDFAKEHNVAFLVVGDPFAATTHTDLVTRCCEKGVCACCVRWVWAGG